MRTWGHIFFYVCLGETAATCTSRSNKVDFTLPSGLCNASNSTGTMSVGTANELAVCTIAVDASSAASLNEPDDDPHSSNAGAPRTAP